MAREHLLQPTGEAGGSVRHSAWGDLQGLPGAPLLGGGCGQDTDAEPRESRADMHRGCGCPFTPLALSVPTCEAGIFILSSSTSVTVWLQQVNKHFLACSRCHRTVRCHLEIHHLNEGFVFLAFLGAVCWAVRLWFTRLLPVCLEHRHREQRTHSVQSPTAASACSLRAQELAQCLR